MKKDEKNSSLKKVSSKEQAENILFKIIEDKINKIKVKFKVKIKQRNFDNK